MGPGSLLFLSFEKCRWVSPTIASWFPPPLAADTRPGSTGPRSHSHPLGVSRLQALGSTAGRSARAVLQGHEVSLGAMPRISSLSTTGRSPRGPGPRLGMWEIRDENVEGLECQTRDSDFIPKAKPHKGYRQRGG